MWIIKLVLITSLIHPSFPQINHNIMKTYGLLYPYEWKTGDFVDLENMHDCYCPRVYWPVCTTLGVTYPNHCVLLCDKKELKRLGPCITYRRDGANLGIAMPKKWLEPPRGDLEKITPGEFVMENATSW